MKEKLMSKSSARRFRMYAIRACKKDKMLMKSFLNQLKALEGERWKGG